MWCKWMYETVIPNAIKTTSKANMWNPDSLLADKLTRVVPWMLKRASERARDKSEFMKILAWTQAGQSNSLLTMRKSFTGKKIGVFELFKLTAFKIVFWARETKIWLHTFMVEAETKFAER